MADTRLADRLEALPTLSTGQTCDLKMDDGETRTWLSRCGIADGMCCPRHITIEHLVNGRWTTLADRCSD